MSFDSFYGGRHGASFVIVYQFDGIDIPQNEGSYVYKIKRYATTSDGFLIYNNGFVEKDANNYLQYTWKYVALDGTDVTTKRFEGDTTTYTITKPAKLAEGMRQCFEKGGDTTDQVNYGEYVMIVATNENDPDNGKIYRRGMNFDYNPETNPLAGAVYVGQVRGPKGEVTKVDFDHYNSIWNRYHDNNNPSEQGWYEYDFSTNTYAVSTDVVVNITKSYYSIETSKATIPPEIINPHEGGYFERSGDEPYYTYILTGDTTIVSGKDYYTVIPNKLEYVNNHIPVTVDEYTPSGDDIIPGYWIDDQDQKRYEDNIRYIYAQFVDEYGQAEGTVIGFKIPTLVQDYEARTISPYKQRKREDNPDLPNDSQYYNYDLIYEDPDQYIDKKWQHPFYQKWQIKIPHGYHGTNSTNVEIVHTKTKPAGYHDYINHSPLFNYDSENDVYTIATDVDSTVEKGYWNLAVSSKNFSWPLTPSQEEFNPSEAGYYEKTETTFFATSDTAINVDKTYYVLTPTEATIKRHYAGTPVYDDPNCTQEHIVSGSPLILTSSVNILKEDDFPTKGTIYKYFDGVDPITEAEFAADHYIYNACDKTLDDFNSCRINYEGETLYVKKEDCYMDVIRYRETNYDNYGDDLDIYGNEIGEVRYYYLGAYNEIVRITLSENGTLTTFYTGAETTPFDQAIRWIDTENAEGVTLDDHGTLKLYYNTLDKDGKHEQEEWYQKLQWIDTKNADGITFDDHGTVRVFYNTLDENGDHNKEEWYQKIKWIYDENDGITFDDNGTVSIYFNTLDNQGNRNKKVWEQLIKWIYDEDNGITFDDNGTVTIYFNTFHDEIDPDTGETIKVRNKHVWEQLIRWIDDKNADGITFDDDGTVTVYYNTTHEEEDPEHPGEMIEVHDKEQWNQKIRWIDKKNTDGITFDEHGTVKVFYNTFHEVEDPETHEKTKERDIDTWYQQIKWIDKGNDPDTGDRLVPIEYDDNGTVRVFYNTLDNEGNRNYDEWEQVLRWIDTKNTNGITIADDGTVTVYYNTFHKEPDPEDPEKEIDVRDTSVFPNVLDWVTNISINQEGDFEVLYNNNTIQEGRYYQKLHWIDFVDVSSDGIVSFYYNDDHDNPVYQAFDRIKYLADVQVQTVDPKIEEPAATDEGTGDQKIHLTFNTGETAVIGEPLNYIIEAVISTPDPIDNPDAPYSHLLIYYSDPKLRKTLHENGYPFVEYTSAKYPGHKWTEWLDFGDIHGKAGGIHIIEDIDDLNKLKNAEGKWIPPEKLQNSFGEYIRPDGAGWSVTYTPAGQNNPTIYCYDYNTLEWFPLGIINPLSIVVKSEPVEDTQLPDPLDVAVLKENGLWLASETAYYAF